jgi:hypothetical protein
MVSKARLAGIPWHVNFLGLDGVVVIVSTVVDNVDASVVAQLDVLGEGGSDDMPPSLKGSCM